MKNLARNVAEGGKREKPRVDKYEVTTWEKTYRCKTYGGIEAKVLLLVIIALSVDHP